MVKARALVGLLALLGLIAGCGTGGGGGLNPTIGNTRVLLNIGDASSDRVLAFSLAINSATLITSANSTATVFSTATAVEFTRRGGVFQPLAVGSITRATYSQLSLTLGAASVTFIDPNNGNILTAAVTPSQTTVNLTLTPELQLGSAPAIVNIDFNLGSSIGIDGSNNVTLTPNFTASGSAIAASGQTDTTGAVQDVTGVVTASSSSSITISAPQAVSPLTFALDGSSTLVDTTVVPSITPGSIPVNSVVEVTGTTRTDGTFLATRVELKAAAGHSAVEGIIVDLPALPATQFTTRAVHMASQSTALPVLGAAYLATGITTTTPFSVDSDLATLTGLPFTPTFDRNTIREIQNVEVFAATPDAASVTAARVRLQEQSITGLALVTASGTNTATITLTPDTDSAFAVITGQPTLTVFQQPNTLLTGFTSVPSGTRIRARGLLFFDPGDSTFKMVATQITAP
jgi:hypothetical protein